MVHDIQGRLSADVHVDDVLVSDDECRNGQETRLPERLIDLSNSPANARLVDGRQKHLPLDAVAVDEVSEPPAVGELTVAVVHGAEQAFVIRVERTRPTEHHMCPRQHLGPTGEPDMRATEARSLGQRDLPCFEHRIEVATMHAAIGKELDHLHRSRPGLTRTFDNSVMGILRSLATDIDGGAVDDPDDRDHHDK